MLNKTYPAITGQEDHNKGVIIDNSNTIVSILILDMEAPSKKKKYETLEKVSVVKPNFVMLFGGGWSFFLAT